jgi:hypothetical protein
MRRCHLTVSNQTSRADRAQEVPCDAGSATYSGTTSLARASADSGQRSRQSAEQPVTFDLGFQRTRSIFISSAPETEYLDLTCASRLSVRLENPSPPAALVGANVGANVHSYQAIPSDVQRTLPKVIGMLGDTGLRLATGWS